MDQLTLPLDFPPGWEAEAEAFAASWNPSRPLAGSTKDGGKWHTTRTRALTLPYIETNAPCLQSLIVTDVDATDVDRLPEMVGLPAASWAVRRDDSGTGHIGYALTAPVCLTDAGRRRPVNLLARIEVGLRDVLGGDVGYAGRFTKNPITPPAGQATLWGEEFPTFQLRDLAASLDQLHALPHWRDPAPRQASGVGRNVDVFDRTRTWAYRAIRRYWTDGFDTWAEIVHDQATIRNEALEHENRHPLPTVEVAHLARSIARWTWRRFTPETWKARQTTLGRKAGTASAEKRWGARTVERLEML